MNHHDGHSETRPLIDLDPASTDTSVVIALLGIHRTEITVVQTAVATGTLTARIVADYLAATERAATAVQRHMLAPPPMIDLSLKAAAQRAWAESHARR